MKSTFKIMLLIGATCASATSLANQTEQSKKAYSTQSADVARVISIQPERTGSCHVQPARMVYEDSQGQRHEMNYKVMGTGCGG